MICVKKYPLDTGHKLNVHNTFNLRCVQGVEYSQFCIFNESVSFKISDITMSITKYV